MANEQQLIDNLELPAHLRSLVESPSDLLAVGLANSGILALADPDLIYRSIRCKLGNTAVWEHLAANPEQAKHVLRIEVVQEHECDRGDPFDVPGPELLETVGRTPHREDVERAELLLLSAIRNTSNLEDFSWNRWVPTVNRGDDAFGSVQRGYYTEDVWTALRDHTKLRKLKVVDLGTYVRLFADSRPIFNSELFSLKNLTHVDLAMYYSPVDVNEGAHIEDDDPREVLHSARVKLDRILDLFGRCPNLESVVLSVNDHPFYLNLDGNPFTDATNLFRRLRFAELHTLVLQDITVQAWDILHYLHHHPKLRNFSGSLSIEGEDLRTVPFNFASVSDHIQPNILPNLEILRLPSEDLRPILNAIARPSPIRSLGVLHAKDWFPEDDEHDEHYVSSLSDVWGEDPGSEGSHSSDESAHNLSTLNPFANLPNLRDLVVEDVTTLSQLDKLIELTPQLESIEFQKFQINPDVAYETDFLPRLSRWSQLTKLDATFFWPEGYEMDSEEIQTFVQDLSTSCPLLRETTWVDGQPVQIMKDEDGTARLVAV